MKDLLIVAGVAVAVYLAMGARGSASSDCGGKRFKFPHVHQWPLMLDSGNRQGPYYVGPGSGPKGRWR